MSGSEKAERERWIAELSALRSEDDRRSFFAARPDLQRQETVDFLSDRVNRVIREDLEAAGQLLETVRWLAERLGDDSAWGRYRRASANLLVSKREFGRAIGEYEAAVELFGRAGNLREMVRTLSSGLSPLSYTGEYRRALRWATKARRLCHKLDDPLLLARLEFNHGHVLSQQDRLTEALERYRSAHQCFLRHGEATDVAAALRNIAVCHQQLDDFAAAVEVYREAADFCAESGLDRLGLEVEYNEAYLHFLRGDHERSIRLLEAIRVRCEELGDKHHAALCDLDLAEIYLELNLLGEAATMAARAVSGFEALGMRYEAAKALSQLAIALSRQGREKKASTLLERARESFSALGNRFWTAQLDFFGSSLMLRRGRFSQAADQAAAALEVFLEIGLPARIAACEILLARLAIVDGRSDAARQLCARALSRVAGLGFPAVEYQAHLVTGRVAESAGDREAALRALRRAESTLEGIRSQLHADELKIAFSRGRQSVYWGLLTLLAEDEGPDSRRQAFDVIQKAKSRSLAELLASRGQQLPPTREVSAEIVREVGELRAELNWFYRQADREESRGAERSLERIDHLRKESSKRERSMLRALRRLQMADPELAALEAPSAADLESVRSTLPPGTQLLEYFTARGVLYACLLDRRNLTLRRLARVSELETWYRGLELQIQKLQLQPPNAGLDRFGEKAVKTALARLHDHLIGPLRRDLDGQHLIVAPHGLLHRLPFHAFFDGQRHLIDEFSVSYSPSATVFQLCCTRQRRPGDEVLVMGVPDERAPLIRDEVRAVAGLFASSRLLEGADASAESLQRYAGSCRILHIASHGLFHRENPMFSAVQLGASRLTLFDLYDLRLGAELVVMSGCSTGMSAVRGADELVGLTRGLLYAGARAVLVTLWDVADESTRRFMTSFYTYLKASSHPAMALQRAQRELREEFPHPYHWAPFVLTGSFDTFSRPL